MKSRNLSHSTYELIRCSTMTFSAAKNFTFKLRYQGAICWLRKELCWPYGFSFRNKTFLFVKIDLLKFQLFFFIFSSEWAEISYSFFLGRHFVCQERMNMIIKGSWSILMGSNLTPWIQIPNPASVWKLALSLLLPTAFPGLLKVQSTVRVFQTFE